MLQAGVILSDYATLMVEILKDNARPEAGVVFGAIDMPWAKLCRPDRAGIRKIRGAPVGIIIQLTLYSNVLVISQR
jgi:hypothetical protein